MTFNYLNKQSTCHPSITDCLIKLSIIIIMIIIIIIIIIITTTTTTTTTIMIISTGTLI